MDNTFNFSGGFHHTSIGSFGLEGRGGLLGVGSPFLIGLVPFAGAFPLLLFIVDLLQIRDSSKAQKLVQNNFISSYNLPFEHLTNQIAGYKVNSDVIAIVAKTESECLSADVINVDWSMQGEACH